MSHPLPKLEYPISHLRADPNPAAKSTNADAEFWFLVVESLEANVKIDFDKLAGLCRYKNAHTARTIFCNKRKQMRQQQVELGVLNMEATKAVVVKKERRKRDCSPADGRPAKRYSAVKREIKEEVGK